MYTNINYLKMKTGKNQNQIRHRELNIRIEGKDYQWNSQFITGSQLKDLAEISKNEELYLSLIDPWDDELVPNDAKVDLARPGIENFYIRPLLKFRINSKNSCWNEQYITGLQIRNLGDIAEGHEIYLKIKGKFEDELVLDNDRVNLARPGIEKFYSKDSTVDIVKIKIGDKEYAVRPGKYSGAQIKEIGDVPKDYELEQIIQGKLVPIEDTQIVKIKGGEKFIGHPKDGQSS
eukprot:gnl/MRDRNA2_/MRDRNA2_175549_c0_seq1.p1 gnl/MRDRNA2_/MRDRNA2_175549_c0~~gnl/MRDRNA2_/MRDRNA2_175549_c0_seq1.p1  ORF type:complete len:233 (+),score=8.74 gnl/MRDRNA2_/MRDRNA2_175549_c0_seq1:264-962(+)